MIYLISTNRPEWAEFAYQQYLKVGEGSLIVLDNSPDGIPFWKDKAQHFHIPQCKNVGEMFNWFCDNYHGEYDLFYMDDDIEIGSDTIPKMKAEFKNGYDCVKLCQVYVTDRHTGKSALWRRRAKHIGAAWMARSSLWRLSRFENIKIGGVIAYFRDLLDYNCRFLTEPLANYILHDKNVILKRIMFDFNLPQITLK